MSDSRLPRKVLEVDIKCGGKGWVKDLVSVCKLTNIPVPTRLNFIFNHNPVNERWNFSVVSGGWMS